MDDYPLARAAALSRVHARELGAKISRRMDVGEMVVDG
jgi:hypothetical protein